MESRRKLSPPSSFRAPTSLLTTPGPSLPARPQEEQSGSLVWILRRPLAVWFPQLPLSGQIFPESPASLQPVKAIKWLFPLKTHAHHLLCTEAYRWRDRRPPLGPSVEWHVGMRVKPNTRLTDAQTDSWKWTCHLLICFHSPPAGPLVFLSVCFCRHRSLSCYLPVTGTDGWSRTESVSIFKLSYSN